MEVKMGKSTAKIGPAKVKAARTIADLTQAKAAQLVYTSLDNRQNWEQSRAFMAVAHYWLFSLKTGQLTLGEIVGTEAPALEAAESMGARIRALRQAKELTQADLAVAVGVTKTAVSAWEIGYSANIRLDTFVRVLDVLGVSKREELIYGKHGPKPLKSGVRSRPVEVLD